MLDELRIEEQMELLKRIARMTEQGKIEWKCEEYNPLSFMDEDEIEETSAYLCQMFRLTANIDGLPYELELAEYITVPDGKGDVAVTLTRDVADDFMKVDAMLSGHFEAYDDCAADELADAFKDDPAMIISKALVPKLIETDVVADTFEWARFINENGISDELLNNPLTLLAEKLFAERRILDYHRIVFDLPYRNKLLAE